METFGQSVEQSEYKYIVENTPRLKKLVLKTKSSKIQFNDDL